MSERSVGKREPSHKPLEHPRVHLDFNELQTSTGNLREQLGIRKEQDRILARIREVQDSTQASYVLFDTVRRIINEGR